jgi:elongation factor G
MCGMTATGLLSLVVTPKTKADQERLRKGIRTLLAEDPTICVNTDQATGEVVLGGIGELHLEVILDRLKREFNVEARVGRPQVAYKETVSRPADGEMKYVEQTDGRGQYAHAKIRLYPGEPGSGYVFENAIVGGTVPKEFINSIAEGIRDALTRGVLAGYPVDDVRIVLYDGSYHDRDSSERAFKIAGSMAFHDAAKKAKPVLLEPVMRTSVSVPHEHAGDVMGSLGGRRGHIESQEDRDGMQFITALVPLAELFGYTADLRSRTRGRGKLAMQFAVYRPRDPPENEDYGCDSMVGVPRTPTPTRRDSSVALPEPIEDDRGD